MKVSVDDKELFTLSDIQKKVIKHEVQEGIFDADMRRRLHYILTHKYEQCFKQLKAEWEPILLAKKIAMVPTDPDAFAELVFSQPEYKNRSQRDAK